MIERALFVFAAACCLAVPASGQTAGAVGSPPPVKSAEAQSGAPDALTIYFDEGSSAIRRADNKVLDTASRVFSEGKPIVMVLVASSDRTGNAEVNLQLSQRRAAAVLDGLINRGIPADRFQVLAKGQTDLPVPTDAGITEPKNRRVDITWR